MEKSDFLKSQESMRILCSMYLIMLIFGTEICEVPLVKRSYRAELDRAVGPTNFREISVQPPIGILNEKYVPKNHKQTSITPGFKN